MKHFTDLENGNLSEEELNELKWIFDLKLNGQYLTIEKAIEDKTIFSIVANCLVDYDNGANAFTLAFQPMGNAFRYKHPPYPKFSEENLSELSRILQEKTRSQPELTRDNPEQLIDNRKKIFGVVTECLMGWNKEKIISSLPHYSFALQYPESDDLISRPVVNNK